MSMAEHNLLVVDQDDSFIAAAKELFEGRLPTARSLEEASQSLASGEVRMMLLGPSFTGDESMEDIRSLHNQDPSLVLMMVADEVTADLLRKGMRAGVSDVLEAPLDEAKIEEAIEQFAHDVLKRQSSSKAPVPTEPESSKGKIITVWSAKGGSGTTVMATNVALLLNRIPDKKVVLVDADLQFGDVCLVLQLEPKFTMVNAAHELHHLDSEMIKSLLTEHPSGLKVLAAPLEPAFADDITTAGLMQDARHPRRGLRLRPRGHGLDAG